MLITFSCKAYADITMFGDIAIQLLKYMGHSGQVPGALRAEDVPEALQLLQAAVERNSPIPGAKKSSNEDDDEPEISISNRALPLIELLQAADRQNCNVMWNS